MKDIIMALMEVYIAVVRPVAWALLWIGIVGLIAGL
jgi:hypothetical protein